jgi:integrase
MAKFALDINAPSLRLKPFKRSLGHKKGHKMKDNKLVFTQGFIERLEAPKARIQYYDAKVQGLLVEIMPTGAKIFRFRKKVQGKSQRTTIGVFPQIGLEEARDAAIKLSAQLVDGEQLSHSRDELTLCDLANLYFNEYANDRCITANKMRQNFDRWWEAEKGKKLSQITTQCLQLRANKLAASGHSRAANLALATVKAIFNWGIKRKYFNSNPASSVDKFKEKSRERFIQPNEFQPLIDSINNYPDERLRDFFLICLYTAARSGNVKAMAWEQIDFELGTWRIPETKNGDSQTIQLSAAALDILAKRYKNRKLIRWVFPGGKYGSSTNHISEPKDSWKKITEKAGVTNLHIHDLRRTLASFMVMTGASTPLVQSQLGHKSLVAAAIYQRVNSTPVKAAADEAIRVMQHYAEKQTIKKLTKKTSTSSKG